MEDSPVRLCYREFSNQVERVQESVETHFGKDVKTTSLPDQIAGDVEWMNDEKERLSTQADALDTRIEEVNSEEFFVHEDEDNLQTKVTRYIQDRVQLEKEDEELGIDASNYEAERIKHDSKPHLFTLPDEQAAFDAYNTEKAELDARRSRLMSIQADLKKRAEALEERRQNLTAEAERVEERRRKLTQSTISLASSMTNFRRECEQATARLRELLGRITALAASANAPNSPNSSSDNSSPSSNTAQGDSNLTPPAPEVQTAPQSSQKHVARDVAEDVMKSLISEGAIQLFKRRIYYEAFARFPSNAKYVAVAEKLKLVEWPGYVWTAMNVLMDSSIKSMDEKTLEVEKNILLVGEYARALQKLKKLGTLKPGDKNYDILRQRLEELSGEMPATSDKYDVSTPLGTLDTEFVYKSFKPAILAEETVTTLVGQYAEHRVEHYAKQLATLSREEMKTVGKAGSAFFKDFGLTVTPGTSVRYYRHFVKGGAETVTSVGAEKSAKAIVEGSKLVKEQLNKSREMEAKGR